jgi:hypothetical protein
MVVVTAADMMLATQALGRRDDRELQREFPSCARSCRCSSPSRVSLYEYATVDHATMPVAGITAELAPSGRVHDSVVTSGRIPLWIAAVPW